MAADLGQERSVEEIRFGISRPARLLRLARPLRIGDLEVSHLMARSADFRGKHKLVRTQAPPSDGAILVNGRVPSQDPLYRITLGLDVLDRCSTVTYDRAGRELRLRCMFD